MKLNCSLLRTCRKINLEAKDFILSSNVFIFAYYVPLIGFLYALGPKKASLLRSIQLNMFIRSDLDELFWDQALRRIPCAMTKLSEIHVFIERPRVKRGGNPFIMEFNDPFLPGILDLKNLRLKSMTLVVWDSLTISYAGRGETSRARFIWKSLRSTTVEKQAWACEMRRVILGN